MRRLTTTLLLCLIPGLAFGQVLIGPQNIRNGAVTPPKLDTAGLYTVGGLTALNLTSPLLTVTGGGTSGTIAYNGSTWVFNPALSVGGGGTWGSITGTLSDQTDLNSALNGKQAADTDLTTIAALVPSAAGKVLKWSGSAWTAGDDENTTYDLSGYLTSATASATYQPKDATLTALAGASTSADKLIYATGSDTFSTTTLTSTARGLLDDTSTSDMQTTLGLGSMAVQNSNALSVTGGTLDGGVNSGVAVRNSRISIYNESGRDYGITGMYDRTLTTNAALSGNVRVTLKETGQPDQVLDTASGYSRPLLNAMFDHTAGAFLTITTANIANVTSAEILIDMGTTQPVFSWGTGYQPFVHWRIAGQGTNGSYFNAVKVEGSPDGVTWKCPTGWDVADTTTAFNPSGFWLGPYGDIYPWRYARFTFTDIRYNPVYGYRNNIWFAEMGVRHLGAPWTLAYLPTSGGTVYGTVTATQFSGPLSNALTAGTGLTSTGTYNGSTARTFAVDFGTGNAQAARGDHLHTGVYQSASAALAQLAGLSPTTTGQIIKWNQTAGAWEIGTDSNSVDAPTDATYITQTPNASLSNEQALSALSTGLVKVTNTTGILSTASAGTDYPGLGTSNTFTGANSLESTSTTATDTQSLVYLRKNGTAAVATGTNVGKVSFQPYGGAAGSEAYRETAAIQATTAEAHDTAAKGGTKLSFFVTGTGSATPAERFTIGPLFTQSTFNFLPDTDGIRIMGGADKRWRAYTADEYSRTQTYTATSSIGTDASTVYLVSGTSTITLPAANVGGSTRNARKVVLIKTDSGTTTTISRAGSDTINKKASGGLTTFTLTQQYESVTLYSNGSSAWYVVAQN